MNSTFFISKLDRSTSPFVIPILEGGPVREIRQITSVGDYFQCRLVCLPSSFCKPTHRSISFPILSGHNLRLPKGATICYEIFLLLFVKEEEGTLISLQCVLDSTVLHVGSRGGLLLHTITVFQS